MLIIKTEGKIKDQKDQVLKGIQAEEKILEYLIQQNRPYNATDLTANLKVIKKSEVIKSLNNLFENQKILMKSFGKQQIYCCLQSKEITESTEELQKIQIKLTKGKEESNSLKDQNNLLEIQLIKLKNQPTSTQISIIKKTLTQQVNELNQKIINLKPNLIDLNPEKINELNQKIINLKPNLIDLNPEKINELNQKIINLKPNLIDLNPEKINELNQIKSKEERNEIDSKLENFKTIYNQRKKIAKEVIKTLIENIEDVEIRNSFEFSIGIENDDSELIKLIELNEVEKLKVENLKKSFSGSKKRSFIDC